MYNEKILSQLKNLNFLYVIKKSNVSAISKKNVFGDTVKFYAQINTNDVIQKISFKATGCTHFIVFCNHFCELVQGNTIENSLKISGDDLEQFVQLDENRKHIIKIILDTFALLIKKYRKGVEKGKIIPLEVEEVSTSTYTKTSKNKNEIKISSITKEHKDIQYVKESKEKTKLRKSKKKESEVNLNNNNEIEINVANSKSLVEKNTEEKKAKKFKEKKEQLQTIEKTQTNEASVSQKTIQSIDEKKIKKDNSMATKKDSKSKEFKQNKVISDSDDSIKIEESQTSGEVEEGVVIVEPQSQENNVVVSDGKSINVTTVERTTHVTSIRQTNNILALQSMIQSSKHTSTVHNDNVKTETKAHVTTLSKMINKISKSDDIMYVDYNSRKLQSLNASLANIRKESATQQMSESSSQKIEENKTVESSSEKDSKKQKKTKEKSELQKKDEKTTETKKKKGLFGWLRK